MTDSKKTTAKDEVQDKRELTLLEKMIKEINETNDKVNIDGRNYTTVAKRTEILRKHLGTDVQIKTKHLNVDNDKVIFKTIISIWDNGDWKVVATGHAEEVRNSNEFNKKSALENAETSSIGRALANLGLAGGEFASMNELAVKTGLIAKADSNVVAHVKELIKTSGISEKAILANYSIKSLDMLKEEDAFKTIKQCLASIAAKKAKVVKNPPKDDDEEEIPL